MYINSIPRQPQAVSSLLGLISEAQRGNHRVQTARNALARIRTHRHPCHWYPKSDVLTTALRGPPVWPRELNPYKGQHSIAQQTT